MRLRGLTGFELMVSRKTYRDDELAQNAFILSCAMGTTEHEALDWMKSHLAGDYTEAMSQIERLSGLAEGTDKRAIRDVR